MKVGDLVWYGTGSTPSCVKIIEKKKVTQEMYKLACIAEPVTKDQLFASREEWKKHLTE